MISGSTVHTLLSITLSSLSLLRRSLVLRFVTHIDLLHLCRDGISIDVKYLVMLPSLLAGCG